MNENALRFLPAAGKCAKFNELLIDLWGDDRL